MILISDGERFECSNGYVQRCVSAIADYNLPDARWACAVLNRYGHLVRHEADRPAEDVRLAMVVAAAGLVA